MNVLAKVFLILVLPLLAITTIHKYYLSVTNINYSQKEQTLQISSRVFIDDITTVLNERYGIKASFGSEEESTLANEYLKKYFKAKFAIKINGLDKEYTFLGKKYEADVIVCYIEVPSISISKLQTLEIKNEILMDLFTEQQNIIHVTLKGKKKSLILIKEKNTGLLKI